MRFGGANGPSRLDKKNASAMQLDRSMAGKIDRRGFVVQSAHQPAGVGSPSDNIHFPSTVALER